MHTIGSRIILVVAAISTLGLVTTGYIVTHAQQAGLLEQNRRAMARLTDSVIEGLQTVMLAGYADIAQLYAGRLQALPERIDLRILRRDGTAAFRDNATIDAVNARLGHPRFRPRVEQTRIRLLDPDQPMLQPLRERVIYEERPAVGEPLLTLLAPIPNDPSCHGCHGGDDPLRGIVKLSTSLAPIHAEIRNAWRQTAAVIAGVIAAVVVLTGVLIRRSVVQPVAQVTDAMARIAGGDLAQRVPVLGGEELSRMAESFNAMARELTKTYSGLKQEQDKLATIILSAREGIVVTDADGAIVLVNPAAERHLGKERRRLVRDGFLAVFDDPRQMRRRLARADLEPEILDYNDRTLSLYAATIRAGDGSPLGSALLTRDVTEERRLERELMRMSTTDPLTGLGNRRLLDKALADELARALRYRTPFAVLLCDIDRFAAFNERHGHDRGDRLLQALAGWIGEELRKVDLAGRYGGEEFAVVLPNTTLAEALGVAERVRKRVAGARLDGLGLTLSIGVAAFPETTPATTDDLVEAADEALHAAKQAGRNRVVAAARSGG